MIDYLSDSAIKTLETQIDYKIISVEKINNIKGDTFLLIKNEIDKVGLIDMQGALLIKVEYENIQLRQEFFGETTIEFYKIKDEYGTGLLDADFKEIVPCEYEEFRFSLANSMISFEKDNLVSLYNVFTKKIATQKFYNIEEDYWKKKYLFVYSQYDKAVFDVKKNRIYLPSMKDIPVFE